MWQPRGVPTRGAAAGVDQRATVIGAVDDGSGVVTSMIATRATGRSLLAFLPQLATAYHDTQMILVMDNAASHKTPVIRAWLQTMASRITVRWLPTYSPQLNLMARVWRFVTSKLACHRVWNDLPSLIHLANRLLHRTRAHFTAPPPPHLTVQGYNVSNSA